LQLVVGIVAAVLGYLVLKGSKVAQAVLAVLGKMGAISSSGL
jgi:hypothetical protein